MKSKYTVLIILFTLLLIGFNVISYSIFYNAFPEKSADLKLWLYLDSSTFKVISGTLILPIIIILLENRFKIIEAAQEKRLREEEQVRQHQIDRRREVLNSIISDWDTLYNHINELRFFEHPKNDDKSKSKKNLSEIQTELMSSISNWDKNINELYYYYPNLRNLEPMFLYYLNLFITISISSAFHIKNHPNDEKFVNDFQHSYEVVMGLLKTIWYHNFVSIIKNMNEKFELKTPDKKKIEELDSDIQERVDNLKLWAAFLVKEEFKFNPILDNLNVDNKEDFNQKIEAYSTFIKENPKENIYNYDNIHTIETEYKKIDHTAMMKRLNVIYTQESIVELAKSLGYHSFLVEIQNRSNNRGLDEHKNPL